MMTKIGEWFREHETTSRQRAPFFHASLQGADLAVDERARLLSTQACEEFFGGAMGFGLEPSHNPRPLDGKGIRSRAPVARWLGSFAMRGAHLARSPRVRQTVEKTLEIRIAMRKHVDGFTGGEPGEVMLNRANFIEEPQRIQGAEDGAQPIFHRVSDRGRRQQSRTRRFRRVIPLADMGAVPLFAGELERGLKEIHKQARRASSVL